MTDKRRALRRLWSALGPGLITGAADDDPSGIATYSQAGAQFGYAFTWTMFLTLPFMAAIQIVSACIGWETKKGLTANIGAQLPKPIVYLLVSLLVPIMFAMMHIVSSRHGARVLSIPRWLRALGWLAAALMAAALGSFVWL